MSQQPARGLSHADREGNARMVDVGGKPTTDRRATAEARVAVGADVAAAIRENTLAKGDLLSVARLGGVQAAKRTSDLVLLCHPLPLAHVEVDARLDGETVVVTASARAAAQTGVEMEALTAAAGAALNVVDMGKALNPRIVVESLRVVEKTGGKTLAGPLRGVPEGLRVGVLAVSDSRSAGDAEDRATPALVTAVTELLGVAPLRRAIVPDEAPAIVAQLRTWTAGDEAVDLVLTTGGTGVAPRDVTPEATAEVIDRPHPGLLELARARCLPGKPKAFLSRAVAGVAGETLVVNLPGSPKGAVEMLRLMADALPHTLAVLRGASGGHPAG